MHTTDEENPDILKDGTSDHINHLPDHRAITIQKVMQGLKRHAEEHPNEPPQQVRLFEEAGGST